MRRTERRVQSNWWVWWLRDVYGRAVDLTWGQIPPRAMPWALKGYMIVGLVGGAMALMVAWAGRPVWEEELYEIVARPGGRIVLGAFGVLGVAQAVLACARLKAGLYVFWGFNALLAGAYLTYYGRDGLLALPWAVGFCVYAWLRRDWFRGCGTGASPQAHGREEARRLLGRRW